MRTVGRLAATTALLLSAGCAGSEAAPGTGTPSFPPPPATSAAPSATAAPSSAGRSSAAPTPTPTAASSVPATLRFSSTTAEGRAFDGATLAGQPVLLWFWAPWCPTCRSQIEQVQAVARDHEGRVAVVGVGSLDDAAAIRTFAAQAPGLTHLTDETGAVFRHFGVTQQSSFVLLDARGEKVWSVGYGGGDDLAERVAAVAG